MSEQTDETPAQVTAGLSRQLLLLSVVMAVCTVLLLLLPVSGRTMSWSWTPLKTEPAERTIEVVAGAPAELILATSCSAVRSVPNPGGKLAELFRTLGERPLSVGWADGRLVVTSDGQRLPGIDGSLGPSGCSVTVTYSRATDSVTVDAGTGAQTASAAGPSELAPLAERPTMGILGFRLNRAILGETTVSFTTRPATLAWPGWRWLLVALALTCWVLAARALHRTRTREQPVESDRRARARWTLSDTVIALSGVIALFVIPPLSDDGWVLQTVRQYPLLGFFTNYPTASAAPQPQGFWWAFLEQVWLEDRHASLLQLRLPSVLIVLAGWWILRSRVIDEVVPSEALRAARTVAASITVVGLFAWTPTLRPEPVIALLLAVQISLVMRYRRAPHSSVLLIMGGVAAVAFAAHQSGWTVLTAACAALPLVWRWTRAQDSPRRASTVVASIAVMTAAAVLTLLSLHANLDSLRWSAMAFRSEGAHDQALAELLRVARLAGGVPPVRMFSFSLILLSSLAFLLRRPRNTDRAETFAGYASICGIAGLVLTSSKWPWHLGAVWPAAAVLGVLGLVGLRRAGASRNARLPAIGAAVALIVAWLSVRYPGPWAGLDVFASNTSLHYPPSWLPPKGLGFWLLVGVPVAVGVAWLLRRYRIQSAAAESDEVRGLLPVVAALVSGVALVCSVSVLPLIADASRADALTWPEIVARDLSGARCGLAGDGGFEVPTSTRPLSRTPGPDVPENERAAELPFSFDRVAQWRPTSTAVFTLAEGSAVATTPWFRLTASERSMLWFTANRLGRASLTIQWRGAESAQSTEVEREFSAAYWQVLTLEPPAGADSFRIRWNPDLGISTVTAPVASIAESTLAALAGDSAVWQPPYTTLWASCLRPPHLNSGIVEEYDWIVATSNDLRTWRRADVMSLWELGCQPTVTQRMCAYAVARPQIGTERSEYGIAEW